MYTYKCKRCNFKWKAFDPNFEDIPKKLRWYEWNLSNAQKRNNKARIAYALNTLSIAVLIYQGDCPRACALGEQSLSMFRQLGDKVGLSYALNVLGETLIYMGNYERSNQLLQECLILYQELKNWEGLAYVYSSLGFLRLYQAKYEEAKAFLIQSVNLLHRIEATDTLPRVLQNLAEIAVVRQQLLLGVRLFGAEEALRESGNIPIRPVDYPRYEKIVRWVSSQLGDTTFLATWKEGSRMSIDEAITLATKV